MCSWVDSTETWGHPDAMCMTGQPRGQTMLMAAALHGRLNCVVALLDRGAHMDQQDINGDTALMQAARRRMCGYGSHDGSDKCVRFLLSQGADANIPNNSGVSARTFINPAFNAGAFLPRRPRTAPSLSMVSIAPSWRAAPSRRVFPEPMGANTSYSLPGSPAPPGGPVHLPARFDPMAASAPQLHRPAPR